MAAMACGALSCCAAGCAQAELRADSALAVDTQVVSVDLEASVERYRVFFDGDRGGDWNPVEQAGVRTHRLRWSGHGRQVVVFDVQYPWGVGLTCGATTLRLRQTIEEPGPMCIHARRTATGLLRSRATDAFRVEVEPVAPSGCAPWPPSPLPGPGGL